MLGQERRSKASGDFANVGVTEDSHLCACTCTVSTVFLLRGAETFANHSAFLMSLNSQMMAHQRSSIGKHFALDAHLILDKQSLMNFQPNGKRTFYASS